MDVNGLSHSAQSWSPAFRHDSLCLIQGDYVWDLQCRKWQKNRLLFRMRRFTIVIMISPMISTRIYPSAIIIKVEIALNEQYMLMIQRNLLQSSAR